MPAARRRRRAGGQARGPARGVRAAVSERRLGARRGLVQRLGPSCGSGCGRTRSTSRGRSVERIAERCRELDLYCAIGVNEREAERPGSLYNTLLLLGPDGLLHKHRKLMPTMHERLFHGIGAGDDLAVTETPIGRVGGLICWENRMPLARYALYRGGPQIWVAPTADDSDGWLASMRHIAIESGAYVVSVPQYIPAAAFPDDFPAAAPGRQGGVRTRRRRDLRARRGRGDRRPAVRPGGDRGRGLRPRRRPASEALVRRRRPLQPRGSPRSRE